MQFARKRGSKPSDDKLFLTTFSPVAARISSPLRAAQRLGNTHTEDVAMS